MLTYNPFSGLTRHGTKEQNGGIGRKIIKGKAVYFPLKKERAR